MPTAKPAPQYDVFISYRRGTADDVALLLQEKLQKYGITAFLDRDLQRGTFDDTLLRRIVESPTFLIILTPGALDRCSEDADWLSKEILQAINSKRNIIPLQVDSFQFSQEVVRKLDPAIRSLSRYQTVEYSRAYFENTVERIAKIVAEDKAERRDHAEEAERRLAAERAEARKKEPEKREEKERIEQERLSREQAEHDRPAAQQVKDVETGKAPTERRKTLLAVPVVVVVILWFWWLYRPVPKTPPNPGRDTPNSATAAPIAGTDQVNSKDGQKYVWIPPGTLQMGCSAGDSECYNNEKPAHPVTISKGFWIGQTLVTQAAYPGDERQSEPSSRRAVAGGNSGLEPGQNLLRSGGRALANRSRMGVCRTSRNHHGALRGPQCHRLVW